MPRSIGAVLLAIALVIGMAPGPSSAQVTSARSVAYAAYSEDDLVSLIMLVMVEDARRGARDLQDIMGELAARNKKRADLIEARGIGYFVDEALAQYSRQIGRSSPARDAFEAMLIMILDPQQASDAMQRLAASRATDRDLKQAADVIEKWAASTRAATRGIEGAEERFARLAANTSDAMRQVREMGQDVRSQYSEEDVMSLLMLVLMESARSNADDIRNLMTQLAAQNRERAKLIEARGGAYFVDEALKQYARHIGGNDAVRGLVEALLVTILDPAGGGKAKLETAAALASAADFRKASEIIEDWVAGVHATIARIDDGKARLSKLVSNSSRAIRLAQGLVIDGGSAGAAANRGEASLAGGGTGGASASGGAGGSSSGGSANFDTSQCQC